jgi:ABC-type dipeptide/oligopeptide/nickel transport system permease component
MIRTARHGLLLLVVMWLAVTIAFFALRVLPGDAIQAQLREAGASQVVIEQRRAEQGFNDPLVVQYVRYLGNVVRGDLGLSLLDNQPVQEIILRQLPPTITLATGALIFAAVAGVGLGIMAANERYGILALTARTVMNLSLSTPIYWTSTLAIYLFSGQLGLLPSTGAGRFSQLILPVSILGFHSAGAIARMIETSVREASRSDFVRTARAKGLPERLVQRKHILRVGLLPAVTVILLQAGFLLSGTVITERIFVRPGIGMLLVDRVLQQDYPVVQGIVIFMAVVYTILNALGDLIYPLLDPRVTRP